MKLFKLAPIAAALVALTVGSAQAGLVTFWDVGVDSVFDPLSIVATGGTVGTPPSVVISNSDRTLRWGTNLGDGQSGLDITGSPTSAIVETDRLTAPAPYANISVTHTNNPIGAPSLDRVTLLSTLTLTPNTPMLPGFTPPTLEFGINFLETPNQTGTGNICADGGTEGVGVNINGCADIFVIEDTSLNFSFFYDTDGPGANDPPVEYFISFFELTSGLNPLPTAACLAATGSSDPCLGFRTAEGTPTTVQFASVITTERVVVVPEPGSLALAGVALAGLAGIGRRRKALQA